MDIMEEERNEYKKSLGTYSELYQLNTITTAGTNLNVTMRMKESVFQWYRCVETVTDGSIYVKNIYVSPEVKFMRPLLPFEKILL